MNKTTHTPRPGYKRTALGWIPEEWEVKKLEEVSIEIIDCEHKTPEFTNEKFAFYIRTKNVKDGRIIYDDAKYVNKDKFEEWTKRGIPQPGNVLYS